MTTVISIHSFRGGTGKSNTASNVAGQLVSMGYRVGVVDTDIQSPGIHVLFGFSDDLATPPRTSNCRGVSLSIGVFGLETSSATS